MKVETQVELQLYSSAHDEQLKRFSLPQEQEQFTALPIEMLEVHPEKHPVVILSEQVPVGFFVLHASDQVKEYTDNPHAMLLTSFSINFTQQGKGLARRGLEQLRPFVRHQFLGCDEIVLAVNQKNIPAQKLYEKIGFQDTGRRKIGPLRKQYIMSLSIE
ncbi:GNAT family N-acetyltransferase [Paenibacillus selenitireducens]|uniref:GNAT family N-acetyltransferase n=1 Tax=Paenibacillus selenitireducens TaxID=1324314 RepID=A0A1T2X5U3_9BACL|nr:GNAT family N-acetyltransferase [Paenibacillus selenitireducens]OPA75210.1 GNAT family N-acetyltransferase [Paenibacillus selenitireducens]